MLFRSTGATGYLGSHLVKALLDKNHHVIILKRSASDTRRIAEVLPRIASYDVDRCELSRPFEEHGPMDAIFHTATTYGRKGESVSEIFETNTAFPLRLLETATAFKTETFFNTDTSLPRDLNAYAFSKKQFMEWGKLYTEQEEIRFVNIVLEHFYGSDDDDSKFTTWVIKSCLQNVPELKLTTGDQKRDFIYIDDVVEAYLLLIGNIGNHEVTYHEFGLGSGTAVTVRQFVELVHRLAGSRTRLHFGAVTYRPNEQMELKADISLFEKLGWRCNTTLQTGIEKTIEGERSR